MFTGERISRKRAAYRIGSEQSYEHTYRATVNIPSNTTAGIATVGLYTYRRGDSQPKRMYALFPANVVRRPVGNQAKGFEWDITGSVSGIFPKAESVDNFVNNTAGTCNDQDGAYGCQCVDLMHLYIDNVLGVPRYAHDIRGNALPIYSSFPSSKTIRSGSRVVRLEKIPNTPHGIPRKGDIIFFSHRNGIGHVSIFIEGNAKRFTSLDQNWHNANRYKGSPAAIVEHRYTGEYSVAGWLRPVLVSY